MRSRRPSARGRGLAWTWGLLLAAALSSGCGPNLRHVGYTGSNKVWYHWDHGAAKHTIVVCDVQPDGSEANCRESEI